MLALGIELEARLQAYRAAAEHLAEARATAAAVWPTVPAEIVVDRQDRDTRHLFADCYEPETDCEGEEVWPEPHRADGRLFGLPPRDVLRSTALLQFADVRAEPDDWEDDLADDLAGRIRAAERYEAACVRRQDCTSC